MRATRHRPTFFGTCVAVAAAILLGACSSGSSDGGPSEASRPAALADVQPIALEAPAATDAGAFPVFRWSPVDGAASYRLAVIDERGPLWGWAGTATEIRFGATPTEPADGYGGPRLDAPAWWSVAALDATGQVVALSNQRSVSPDGRTSEWAPGAGAAPGESTATAESGTAAAAGEPTPADADGDAGHACDLFTDAEAEQFLGVAAGAERIPETRRGGEYTSCTWADPSDGSTKVVVSVNKAEGAYNPTGWTRTPTPVDGLGDSSFSMVDGVGIRIGFLRDGTTVQLTSGFGADRLEDAIGLARLADQRLPG